MLDGECWTTDVATLTGINTEVTFRSIEGCERRDSSSGNAGASTDGSTAESVCTLCIDTFMQVYTFSYWSRHAPSWVFLMYSCVGTSCTFTDNTTRHRTSFRRALLPIVKCRLCWFLVGARLASANTAPSSDHLKCMCIEVQLAEKSTFCAANQPDQPRQGQALGQRDIVEEWMPLHQLSHGMHEPTWPTALNRGTTHSLVSIDHVHHFLSVSSP